MIFLIKDLLKIMTAEQRKRFYLLQLLVIVTAIAEVVSVVSIGPFMALVGNIDLIENNKIINMLYVALGVSEPLDFLFQLGLLVLLFLFIAAAISIATIWMLSLFAARVGAEFGDSLYEYYLKKDYLYHSRTNSSILTKQIATEVSRVTDNVLQPLVQINARIIASLFISIAVFLYNPLISIIGLLLFSLCYSLLFLGVKGRLARNGNAITNVSRKRFSLMSEGFGAIKEVQLLGREEYFIEEFKSSGRIFSSSYGTSNGLYNMPRYLMEFIVYSGMITLIIVMVRLYSGDLSEILPILAVFGIAAFKLLPSFQQIYSGSAQIKGNLSAFEAIKKDVYDARLMKKKVKNDLEKQDVSLFEGGVSLELSSVSFKYPDKEEYTLKGISLKIPSKKIIGIVGPSGSGKSTLVDIMLGVLSPNSGSIAVNGKIIDQYNIKAWQTKLGYVPQAIFLKEGSIAENIAFGIDNESIEMDKIDKAIKLAHLDEWVGTLSDGIKTNVGERGVQLSGGQRQRIGIARSLYNDAEFLFFDEATSALDGVTENIIMDAIDKISESKTIVMIAHRLNTVKKCDHIIMVCDGNIVDQGTYEYLLNNNSSFKKMAIGR